MNILKLRASLIAHEGEIQTPYLDSVGVWTVGVGHNMKNPISRDVMDHILDDDINAAVSDLNIFFPHWLNHNDERQNVLIEMMFNLGASRLRKFYKMWAALMVKNYDQAAFEMLDSTWADQVGQRAKTLADRMREG